MDDLMIRFFRDDIGGILITDEGGAIQYEDEKSAFIRKDRTNWKTLCPPPAAGQRAEQWELVNPDSKKMYMVTTSTYEEDGRLMQIHFLVDISQYMGLSREMSHYSRMLKSEKERDGLTGLYNKGKFVELKRSLFQKLETIAVFNFDVNNLKTVNDAYGHDAGDGLILKAAESLKRIEGENLIPFRVGGDEFIAVALNVNADEAMRIKAAWEAALADVNRTGDFFCEVACGFSIGEKGFDLENVFSRADQMMYQDKQAQKAGGRNAR